MGGLKIYHIFNRGTDKRKIFISDNDKARFIHNMYEFNDTAPALKFNLEIKEKDKSVHSRDKLVKIHSFCLMSNHYHFICEEIRDGGISLFMKKLQGGYARGFNEKYKRSGHLFGSKYKSILIQDEIYLLQMGCYIHSNSLDLWKSKWRKTKLEKEEKKEALSFLEKYRWSSYLDYAGGKNFPSVIDKDLLEGAFKIYGGHKKFFTQWLNQFVTNTEKIKRYLLG
ncbi:MAG: transposase [Candidatus Omnitrophota bacterium]